jgi:eukaryotic-like serine/threonine-protein kinase
MEIGSQLNNRYTLTARLGQGAMGQVYRATDAQTGQDVALKVIAHDLAFDSEMLQRFRREGEALRQLRHPNIVGFIEMFTHETQNIIVMEFVPGGNLHDLILKGPLPAARARRIALEISDALTRAHHIGIIHRDL